ncbi:extracellular solute-binding protein [Paenibacillus taiwanensis]|uniref:extracellular solute-binding protein n=1 Tax=Paenibacillus taiwanensis TaxID=401638 RepID=UPI000401C02F|nr:extracellular solute-binding protein [Paenibacillus taiwanensis]
MKKSLTLLLTLIFVASAALTGCGSNNTETQANGSDKGTETKTEEPKKAEPFELKLRHTQVGDAKKNRFAILEEVVKTTQGENEGLTIKLDGVESDINRKEKLRGEMAAGDIPDIFDVFGSPDAKLYAGQGKMLDLTPILDELGIKDKFTGLGPFTLDGKVYGLPIGASAEGVFYNKEYFTAKGFKVPTTWAEWEKLLADVKADGKTPLAGASKAAWVPLMVTNQLWSRTAGPEFAKGFATGDAKWTDPTMVKAFAKHKEWVDKGYFKKGELGFEYAELQTQFVSGEAAMMFDGTWQSSIFKAGGIGEKMIGKVGFFNVPAIDGGQGDQTAMMQDTNNGYGFSAKVAEDPRKLAAVKSFIKNLYTEDMQIRGLVEDGVLPAMLVDKAKIDANVTDPLMKEIATVLAGTTSSFPAFDALVQADVNTTLSIEIQKLIGGQTTPEKLAEAVQKVQDEANGQ